jgi:hypothetical protein
MSHSDAFGAIWRSSTGYRRVTNLDRLIHMPAHALLRTPRPQIKKPGSPRASPAGLFHTCTQTLHLTPRTPRHSRPGLTPGAYYRHPIILRSPSMGCAATSTTALLSSAAQLTPVGSTFPYCALAAGLNKTDASFASLVRQVGDGGPP